MKITLCGSIAFIEEMAALQKELEQAGHEVKIPPLAEKSPEGKEVSSLEYYRLKKEGPGKNQWLWDNHHKRIQAHFDKVAWADNILVLNLDKNNIAGYIGPNTLIEMGLAFYLKKPIYLYNPIPDIHYAEEIIGLRPIVIYQDLKKIVNPQLLTLQG